jgi:N6-L-threonylcarbamoyladenine synthase
MNILAIETSCDESAVSILETDGLGHPSFSVLGNTLYSQAALHAEYGGVFPNLAKREHQKNLVPLLQKALADCRFQIADFRLDTGQKTQLESILSRESELYDQLVAFLEIGGKPPIDAIAVTRGPGLAPALWVGVNFAKALAAAWNLPIVPINHMEGHIISALLQADDSSLKTKNYQLKTLSFPALSLLVSGGHTELVLMRAWGEYELVGATRDDAAGEAFDKAARLMGLPYPGGPEISRLAATARASYVERRMSQIALPRPMIHSDNLDFSFSGLKTAVRREFEKIPEYERKATVPHLAREFEDAVVDVLVAKTIRAAGTRGTQTILVGGGVAANAHLRKRLTETAGANFGNLPVYFPDQTLTGDNAVMIAVAAALRLIQSPETPDPLTIVADGNLKLAQ